MSHAADASLGSGYCVHRLTQVGSRFAPRLSDVIDVDASGSTVVETKDLSQRVGRLLSSARDFGLAKPQFFITPEVLTDGGRVCGRLALAFTAGLFNQNTGLQKLSADEMEKVEIRCSSTILTSRSGRLTNG